MLIYLFESPLHIDSTCFVGIRASISGLSPIKILLKTFLFGAPSLSFPSSLSLAFLEHLEHSTMRRYSLGY